MFTRYPKHQIAPTTTFLFGLYFHERCYILIEEDEMVGPAPPRMSTPPLPPYKIAGGSRGRRGRSLSLPSCLRLLHPHKRNAVNQPTGRAPLVRRLPARDRDPPHPSVRLSPDRLGSGSRSLWCRYITGQRKPIPFRAPSGPLPWLSLTLLCPMLQHLSHKNRVLHIRRNVHHERV